jgi:hypothetical protein
LGKASCCGSFARSKRGADAFAEEKTSTRLLFANAVKRGGQLSQQNPDISYSRTAKEFLLKQKNMST